MTHQPRSFRLALPVLFFALTGAAALASATAAQAPPGTDIHLLTVTMASEGPQIGPPRALTDRAGYDNQPHFTADGTAVVYTSIDDTGQADIRRIDIESGDDAPVTRTAESEYSATPTPDGGYSVIRVEPDQKQRLWRFPATLDEDAPVLLLPKVEPAGYHAWIDDERLVLFVLGEPPTLQVASLDGTTPTVIAHDIGRALAAIPGRSAMSFVHKTKDDGWWVTAIDNETGALDRLIKTRPEREDYAWAPDGSIWMGDGDALYRWHPKHDETWVLVETLPLDDVTRLAFHPQGTSLAVVAARPTDPAPTAAPDGP